MTARYINLHFTFTYYQSTDWDATWVVTFHHVPDMSPYDAVAMATAAAYQRRIEHSAVMGVWRPNVLTNFDEIRYTTAC